MTKEERNGNIKLYTYDANGNRTGFTYKIGGADKMNVSYTYDSLNRLSSVTSNGETTSYTYDANGNLLSSTGAVSVNYAYNKANLPISQTDLSLGVTYTSSYDLGGNRRVLGETGKPDITYSYDDYGKLLSEDASSYVINYEYDNRQNRTKMSKTQQGITDVTQYTYGKNNELLRKYRYSDNVEHVTDYTYDANGNQTEVNYFTLTDIGDEEESEEGETDISAGANDYTYFYEYDSFNRLKKSSGKGYVTTYAYDGNNLRQSKTSNGVTTNHYYDGQNVALDETNGESTVYARGLGLLSRTNQDGTQYYHFNIHGDTSALTDSNGEIVLDYRYDAFGNQLKSNENDTNPFRYNGEYFDEETGFVYLRNRYYDPSIGRFITEDPANDGNNWYVYCGNNPVIFIDPEGLDAIIITSKDAAIHQGHTSAVYQDSDGNWFYCYWGNKAAAVIRISDEYMNSLNDFNKGLNKFLNKNGFKNITSDYTSATYIVGDFTDSLSAAYDDVRSAYPNKLHTNVIKDGSTLTSFDDGSLVYQGQNSPYNTAWNNCLDRTYASLSKGTLANGVNVGTYMNDLGFKGGMRPNNATSKFSEVFMNSSFKYTGAYNALQNYATLYEQKSPWAQRWTKANYAKAVIK